MKITLNLATRPYADQGPALKRLRIGMGVLVVLLAGLVWGLLHFHQAAMQVRAQEDQLNRQIAGIKQEEQGYQRQMQQPDNAKVLTQAGFLNGLFDEKAFSWTAAMEDLERVLPGGVQVTAIEPEWGKDGRLTLRLKVLGLRERSVEMVRNMERSPRFTSPRIAGESTENNSLGAQGQLQQVREAGLVDFDILAEYSPATLAERQAEIAADKDKRNRPGASGAHAPAPVPLRPRPTYVVPNAQPRPGMPQQAMPPNRMMPMNRPQNPIPGPGSGARIPTGIDANGLKNHEMNRFPPGTVPGQAPQPAGVPQ